MRRAPVDACPQRTGNDKGHKKATRSGRFGLTSPPLGRDYATARRGCLVSERKEAMDVPRPSIERASNGVLGSTRGQPA